MKNWILSKLAFRLFKTDAQEHLKDKEKTVQLMTKAEKKALSNKTTLSSVWHKLQITFQLLKSWAKGEYKDIPYRTLITIVVGLVYFVSPIDVVPDFIAGLGIVDDVAVLGLLFTQIDPDLAKYIEWRKNKANIIDEK
ncbi:YkvA family protein [Falsibacillus pallidus]|uniref:YkvA family protein n=1 Tax=Falsibacillus pallidus TaxID=493781 RepID=UPI003D991B91